VLEDLRLGDAPRQLEMDAAALLDETSRRILALLTGEPRHIDDISSAADLGITQVSALLMGLEVQGLVRNIGAQFYARAG